MITHDDPDVLCLVCGLRTYSDCTCPRREPTEAERELGRQARMTRAELAHEMPVGMTAADDPEPWRFADLRPDEIAVLFRLRAEALKRHGVPVGPTRPHVPTIERREDRG